MNTRRIIAIVVATFGTTLALASAPAIAARPTKPGGGGTSPDPCLGANQNGFPAIGFSRQVFVDGLWTWGIYLADATAKCERLIGTKDGGNVGKTVSIHYDPQLASGTLVTHDWNWVFIASTFSISFDEKGVPTVVSSAFGNLLRMVDLPSQGGWMPTHMGDPRISPDGSAILFRAGEDSMKYVVFRCDMDPAGIDPRSCNVVHTGSGGNGASWASDGAAIYVTETATSGSGTSLYRVSLNDGVAEELWSRGTMLGGPVATLIGGVEHVAVYEPGGTSGCASILVTRPSTCNKDALHLLHCDIENGVGHPARSLTWLPDGRIAGEGQSAPNRKNKCSSTGTIVTFEPTDQNGTTTPLTQGLQPEGIAGG